MACKFDLQTKFKQNLECIQTFYIDLRQLIKLLRLLSSTRSKQFKSHYQLYRTFFIAYNELFIVNCIVNFVAIWN